MLINTAFSGTVTPTTSISSFVPTVLSVGGGGIGTKETLGEFWEISNESGQYNSTDFSVWSKKGSPFFVFFPNVFREEARRIPSIQQARAINKIIKKPQIENQKANDGRSTLYTCAISKRSCFVWAFIHSCSEYPRREDSKTP